MQGSVRNCLQNSTSYPYGLQEYEQLDSGHTGSVTTRVSHTRSSQQSGKWETGFFHHVVSKIKASCESGIADFVLTSSLLAILVLSKQLPRSQAQVCSYSSDTLMDEHDASILLNDFRGNISNSVLGNSIYKSWGRDINLSDGWDGVYCDVNGKVIRIELPSLQLKGKIPSSLGMLTHLYKLDLHENNLTGSIPSTLENLGNLYLLYLHDNQLNGSIPSGLGGLKNLVYLLLNNNRLTGNIPASLGNLKKLIRLDVSTNRLTGPIPPSLGNLKNLEVLHLHENQLVGTIPSTLSNLENIVHFEMNHNQLTGSLPSFAENLSNLLYMEFGYNYFYVTFPDDSDNYFGTSYYSTQIEHNCLPGKTDQRSPSECSAFCNVYQAGGPCSGRGVCKKVNAVDALCTCDSGYNTMQSDHKCLPDARFQAGLVIPDYDMEAKSLSKYFRFASTGFFSVGSSQFSWSVAITWDWSPIAVTPARDQKDCKACHAFTTAASVESAYFISHYNSTLQVPTASVQQLIDCPLSSGRCNGGWPIAGLEYAATNGLSTDQKYPFLSRNGSTCSKPVSPYKIVSYEAVQFYNWIGLLLAVQQQPVLVHVEASGPEFQSYARGIFSSENCYLNGVDHTMLLVGYTLGPIPYWILKNSWGPQWGERGFMRMAITSGDGICGINSLPGYFPVFLKEKDPCNVNSFARLAVSSSNPDEKPGRMNPCGGYTCTARPLGSFPKNTCKCGDSGGYFVAANNSDGTQTCVPASPCTFLDINPCGIGRCLDLSAATAPGKYTCMCPIGYLEGFLTRDGTPTCVPSALITGLRNFTVPSRAAVTCDIVYQLYGLSKDEFLKQNKNTLQSAAACNQALPAGKVLNVTSNYLNGCSVPYTAQKGDTCTSINKIFNLAPLSGPGSPNPYLNCSKALQPGQLVCILRRNASNSAPPDVPLCTKSISVPVEDLSCQMIVSNTFGNNAAKFFSLNPGINCNNLKPKIGLDISQSKLSYKICLEATSFGGRRKSCTGTFVFITPGLTCQRIYKKYFNGKRRLYLKANNNVPCDDRKLAVSNSQNAAGKISGFCWIKPLA